MKSGQSWALSPVLTRLMGTEMTNRRQFLAGLLATGLVPAPTWADVGSPAYLSAAALPDGAYVLCGISAQRSVLFQITLPARGHAAAAHPTRPEAVAFARRPGTFAIVIDCLSGQSKATLEAPEGRHFFGHGVFSSNGTWLFTTENDYDAGRGVVGVWDVSAGYTRAGEFASGGVGPHDIKRLPGSETLVVANGGIDTHPDSGRVKLNIATMAPNLSYLQDGHVIDVVSLGPERHKNSIRHLDVTAAGQVAFGMQWEGDGDIDVLAGVHALGSPVTLLRADIAVTRDMRGYVGSIAFSPDQGVVAVTSPRGGVVQLYDIGTANWKQTLPAADVGGVAALDDGFIITTGFGELGQIAGGQLALARVAELAWDNHIVPIGV